MTRRLIVPIAATVMTLAAVLPAGAQEHNRFALGINYTHRLANDELAHGNGGVGIKWRLGHSESGWDRQIGLGWFSTDLEREIGGQTVTFGELKIRPVVAGYGYTYPISDRWHVTGDLVAGLAFTSFELADEADLAFRALPSGPVDTDVSSVIPVLRPEVSMWYDLHPKVGLGVHAGYTVARPKLTIVAGGSRQSERLRADTFSIGVGLVYKIF